MYRNVETITVRLSAPICDVDTLNWHGVQTIRPNDMGLEITYDSLILNAMDVLNRLSAESTVLDFKVMGTPIEDVIVRIYQAQ